MLPFNEPTTMTITSQKSATTNDPVTIGVSVVRPDGSPVVAGSVNFTSASSTMSQGVQTQVRSSSGTWLLKITGLAAGHYVGTVNFTDATQTEAVSQYPVEFDVSQAPTPTPVPTPTPTSTPTPKPTSAPVDPCAGQIRN